MEVRSYRTVFDLERRIYRIDRFRLNPSGVPLRGVAYFALAALALAFVRGVPVAGWAVGALPWYVRYVGLPLGLSALLSVVRIDGRPFHVAAWALWNGWWGSARTSAFRARASGRGRWIPPPLIVIPDGADPWLRPFRFRGPGAVLVGPAHRVLPAAPSVSVARMSRRIRVVAVSQEDSRCPESGGYPKSGRSAESRDSVISLGRGATLVVEGRNTR